MKALGQNSSSNLTSWQASAVARYDCQQCFDEGYVLIEGKGARKCDCLKRKQRERALARIPLIYRSHTLATAVPDAARHPKQSDLLAALRDDPHVSLFLYGPQGCGKTHMGWLAYRQAIDAGRRAIGMTLAELLAQYRVWEKQPDVLPTIIPGELSAPRIAGAPGVLLFLDDVDKARPSAFTAEMLFRLVDAAYSNAHQVIVTSNFHPQRLAAHWSDGGEAYGPAIIRRLLEIENGFEVNLFPDKGEETESQ